MNGNHSFLSKHSINTNTLLSYSVVLAEQLEHQQRNPKQKMTATDLDSTLDEDPSQQGTFQTPQEIFQQLGIDSSDLSIILGTAERILPSITEFVRVHLGVE
jgi:hypothetical protein